MKASSDRGELTWVRGSDGSWAVYSGGGAVITPRSGNYRDRKLFAVVRPARNANGLIDKSGAESGVLGWVVGGTDFDVATWVPTFADAKLRVEALFALES